MICECMSDFLFFFILMTQFNVDLQGGLSAILLTLKGLHNVTNKLFFLKQTSGFHYFNGKLHVVKENILLDLDFSLALDDGS